MKKDFKHIINHWGLIAVVFVPLFVLQSSTLAATYTGADITVLPRAVLTNEPTGNISFSDVEPLNVTVGGTDVTLYKYRIDNGAISAELPISTPITNLIEAYGTHTLEVWGGTGAPLNLWQSDGNPTTATWTIPGGGGRSYVPTCGNAIIDYEIGEVCDDGNLLSGDGCSVGCQIESPLLPSICTGTSTPTSITWNWNMGNLSGITGYQLKELFPAETLITEIRDPNTQNFTENNLLENTLYQNRAVYSLTNFSISAPYNCPAAYTLLSAPSLAPISTPEITSATVQIPDGIMIPNLNMASTGIYFDLIETINGVATAIQSSGWIQSRSSTFFNLSPEKTYQVRYKLRNGAGAETNFSPETFFTTQPLTGELMLSKNMFVNQGTTAEPGEAITIEIIFQNGSNSTLSQLNFKDTLDSRLEYINGSLEILDPLVTAHFNSETQTLEAQRISLAIAEQGSLRFQARIKAGTQPGTVSNQASATYLAGNTLKNIESNAAPLLITISALNIYLFSDTNVSDTFDTGESLIPSPGATLNLNKEGILVGSFPLDQGSVLLTGLTSGVYTIEILNIPGDYLLSTNNNYSITINKNSIHVLDLAAVLQGNPTMTFNILAKPEKRTSGNWDFSAKLKFFEPGTKQLILDRPVAISPDGTATVVTNQLKVGTYHSGIKGDQHLARMIPDINVAHNLPPKFLDFSYGGTKNILAGDLKGDDRINALDLSSLLIQYAQKGESIPADLNNDTAVNASDMALMLINYLKQGEPTP